MFFGGRGTSVGSWRGMVFGLALDFEDGGGLVDSLVENKGEAED